MKKTVVPRERAARDVDDAIAYYAREASEQVALAFIDALERVYRQIGNHPASGSPRYAHALGFEGLRCCGVKPYPYLVFYVEADARVDVLRVLHAERDIPAWIRLPTDD